MTFNLGDANPRPFPVARTAACILEEGRPDILFLQEVPRGKTGSEFSAG
jgi:endonuclease/exonuclease/phosphatase family metal-dependent hydrolase